MGTLWSILIIYIGMVFVSVILVFVIEAQTRKFDPSRWHDEYVSMRCSRDSQELLAYGTMYNGLALYAMVSPHDAIHLSELVGPALASSVIIALILERGRTLSR
jgi:hypothetical protein